MSIEYGFLLRIKKMAKTKTSSDRMHIIKRDNGWAVKREGAGKASKVYDTKEEAVQGTDNFSKSCQQFKINKPGC